MTLIDISEPEKSSILISTRAAGMAIATRITSGTTVQTISIVVLSWKSDALAPRDFRCRNIETIMTPKTTAPMAQQIQKISMCRPWTSRLTSVTPSGMFSSSQPAQAPPVRPMAISRTTRGASGGRARSNARGTLGLIPSVLRVSVVRVVR